MDKKPDSKNTKEQDIELGEPDFDFGDNPDIPEIDLEIPEIILESDDIDFSFPEEDIGLETEKLPEIDIQEMEEIDSDDSPEREI